MKGFYRIYVLVLLLLGLKDICSQKVTISPYPTAVVEQYSSLTLRCSYNSYYKVLLWNWTLNGVSIISVYPNENGTCQQIGGIFNHTFNIYNCMSDNSTWTALTIRNVTEEQHNDAWSCRVHTGPMADDSENTNVFVTVPVKYVNFSSPAGTSVNVMENVATQFICSTSMSRPQSTMRWYITGRADSIGTGTVRYHDYTTVTTSTFSYAFNRSMHAVGLYCTAVNIDWENPVESIHKVILVHYGTNSGPIIEDVSNGSSLSVIDSTQQSLTCYVRGGNPLPTLKWDCFSGTVYNVTRQEDEIRSTITWTASRDWATSTCSCISHQLVSGQQVYRLMVNLLYPPSKPAFRIGSTLVNGTLSIIRGTHVTVTCEASSSPSPYYEWTSNKTSVISNDQKFYLGNTQIADEGTYSCTARNTMRPSMGKEESGNNSSLFVLDVLYPPETPTFKMGTQYLTANVSVVRGDNVKVACDSTSDPGPELQWTEQQPGIRQLTINNIQVATTKNCTVTNTMFPTVGLSETSYTYASLHIIVMSEPTIPGLSYFSTISSNVQLSASDLVVIRGTSFFVLCSGSTSIPGPPSYEWKRLSTRLSASNNLSFTDIGNQDSGIYTCTVTNTMNRTVGATETGQSSKHLEVEVQYPPVIHPLEDQFIDENEPLSLSCTASSNPLPISYIWTRSKDTFVQQSSTLTIQHVKREDSDAYTCTVRNQMFPTVSEGETSGTENYTVNLKVLYHPDVTLTQNNGTVTEGDVNVMLLCAAQGEPQNYTFAKWVHFAPDGTTKIQEYTSTLINNGDAYLIFRTISYMDSGRYQCSVSNGISDYRTGNSFVTSNTDQIVKAKPMIIQSDQTVVSSLHENVSLWTTYYSNDGSTPTTVWYRIRDETKTVLNQTDNIFSADEAFAVSVPFYTVTIARPGRRAQLFINDVMESDFGDYEAVVANSVGKTTSRIRLAVHVEGQTERTAEDSKAGVTAGILVGLIGAVVGAVFGGVVMFRYRNAIKAKCQRSSSSNQKQEQYYMNEQVFAAENVSKEADENNSPNILDENTYEGLDSRRKQDATYESLQLENRKVNKDGPGVYYNLSLQA